MPYQHSHYHHYHHSTYRYGRTAAIRIPYTCGVCGLNTTALNQVPQCAGCLRPLCLNDNHFGYCKQHFDELTPEDQLEIQNYGEKMRRAVKSNILVSFLPLLFVPIMLSPLYIGGLGSNFLPRFLFTLFGSIIAMIFLILYIVLGSRKKITKIMEESRKINQKYTFSIVQTKPNQNYRRNSPNYMGTLNLSSKNVIICPNCGYDNEDDNAKFCTGCGSELI